MRQSLSRQCVVVSASIVCFVAHSKAQEPDPEPPSAELAQPTPKPLPVVAEPKITQAMDRARAASIALASEGYSRRNAIWSQLLEVGEIADIPVQIYARNEYAFAVGVDGAGAAPEISLFDDRGRLVPAALLRQNGVIVLTVSPTRAGVFHLQVHAGSSKAALALTYVFK